MTDPTDAVAASLGHDFGDTELLAEALSHRSVVAEDGGDISNERLEFLGDAVLGLIVAEHLHASWSLTEGEMSKVRAAVVNEATLAAMARRVGISDGIRLGKGEDASGGRKKAPILADAMEAVIGAVYVDGGLESARSVVLELWSDVIAQRAASPGRLDYKTRLQEVLARDAVVPTYRVTGHGPDHARHFEAEVSIEGGVAGRGQGSSKKRAEQEAAREALERYGDPDA